MASGNNLPMRKLLTRQVVTWRSFIDVPLTRACCVVASINAIGSSVKITRINAIGQCSFFLSNMVV